MLRFRRSSGIERQQLTLLRAAGLFAVALFLASWLVEGFAQFDDLGIAMTLIGILAIPVAIGVAMLRYRLYEIDRVISRTLVYGLLTVILGAAYAGSCWPGRRCSRRSPAAAISRSPARRSSSRRCSCRCARGCRGSSTGASTGGATTPSGHSTRSALASAQQVELSTLSGDLRRVVDETVAPAHVSLWMRREARS